MSKMILSSAVIFNFLSRQFESDRIGSIAGIQRDQRRIHNRHLEFYSLADDVFNRWRRYVFLE